MLELDGVTFRYSGTPEVFRFDLHVSRGWRLAVMGTSGSGKSTLLDIVAGHAAPEAGRIAIDGADVTEAPPAKRPVTTVFQDHNTFAHLDVATNVALGIAPDGRPSKKDRQRVGAVLERVGLAGFGHRFARDLSGGERQRVALARAVLRDRPLLLLDEPFAALGPALRADMIALIADIANAQAMTVIFVTHDPADARALATHGLFVSERRIATVGPIDTLLNERKGGLGDYLGVSDDKLEARAAFTPSPGSD